MRPFVLYAAGVTAVLAQLWLETNTGPDNLGLLEWERDTTAAELEAEALDRAIKYGKLGHGYGLTASLKLVGLQLQMLGTDAAMAAGHRAASLMGIGPDRLPEIFLKPFTKAPPGVNVTVEVRLPSAAVSAGAAFVQQKGLGPMSATSGPMSAFTKPSYAGRELVELEQEVHVYERAGGTCRVAGANISRAVCMTKMYSEGRTVFVLEADEWDTLALQTLGE
jgi:hypothetical protein